MSRTKRQDMNIPRVVGMKSGRDTTPAIAKVTMNTRSLSAAANSGHRYNRFNVSSSTEQWRELGDARAKAIGAPRVRAIQQLGRDNPQKMGRKAVAVSVTSIPEELTKPKPNIQHLAWVAAAQTRNVSLTMPNVEYSSLGRNDRTQLKQNLSSFGVSLHTFTQTAGARPGGVGLGREAALVGARKLSKRKRVLMYDLNLGHTKGLTHAGDTDSEADSDQEEDGPVRASVALKPAKIVQTMLRRAKFRGLGRGSDTKFPPPTRSKGVAVGKPSRSLHEQAVSINTNGREMRPHLVSAEDYAAQVNSEEHTAHVFASSPERLKTLQRARREELAGFTPLVKYDMGPLARGAGAYNRARWSPHPGRKKERDATINATLHGAKKGVMPASNKTVAAASQSWFADAQDLRDHHNKFVPRGRAKQTPPWRGRKTKMRLEVRTEQLNNKFNDGSDWRGRATTEATLTDRLISRSPSGQPPRKKARTER